MTSNVHGPEDAHAIKCELAAEALRSYGTLRLQVTGWSMLPAIWPGDILFIERATISSVSEGDIVLVFRERRLCAHRIVKKVDHLRFEARGDANPRHDPVVHSRDLLGKVVSLVRNGKYIRVPRGQSIPHRAIAALVCNSRIAACLFKRVRGGHQVVQAFGIEENR